MLIAAEEASLMRSHNLSKQSFQLVVPRRWQESHGPVEEGIEDL
jgi:hypothetical protein